MARDDHVDAQGLGITREHLEVVDEVQAPADDLGRHDLRNRRRPRVAIVVAAHGNDRRHRAELGEDRGGADVARVHDQVDGRQRRDRLGPQEAVRVGDDADDGLAARFALARTALHDQRV